jgi:hypothetical protein
MSIAMLSHPFGAGQVTIESMSCTIRFTIRINVQHDPGNLSPVGSGRVGVKQTKVRYNVLLIVHSQRRVGRRRIIDIGIERRFLHWHPTQQRMGLATACAAGGDHAFTDRLHFERFDRDDAMPREHHRAHGRTSQSCLGSIHRSSGIISLRRPETAAAYYNT